MDPNRYLRNQFTYCYDGKLNRIDSLINIDGIYIYTSKGEYGTKYFGGMMLYRDGIYASTGVLHSKYTKDKLIPSYKDTLEYNLVTGNYRVYDDTLKVQIIQKYPSKPFEVLYHWYKIIDRNTLKLIKVRVFRIDGEGSLTCSHSHEDYSLLKFHPLSHRKDSSSRFKRYKWFWCDEEKWRQYKMNLESKR